eukprot:3820313-Rhodomonas_salina.4
MITILGTDIGYAPISLRAHARNAILSTPKTCGPICRVRARYAMPKYRDDFLTNPRLNLNDEKQFETVAVDKNSVFELWTSELRLTESVRVCFRNRTALLSSDPELVQTAAQLCYAHATRCPVLTYANAAPGIYNEQLCWRHVHGVCTSGGGL